ncbi:RNA polymerase sigma factor [Paenibacillus sp. Dod16]|uniref:RNA polymerase sigma factor n=1 Tax=Paenibacillus sp. Dod16 TaxID=3416392 RepID=UPI003CEA1A32
MTDASSETEIIRRIVGGEKQLFAVIVDRYKIKVYGIIRSMGLNHQDSQDIAQEAFVKIYRSLANYRDEGHFSAWVYRIVVHAVKDLQRRNRIRSASNEGTHELSHQHTPEQFVLQKEMQRELYHQLQELPFKYRLVLLLKYTNDLTYEEICEITGLNADQVRNAMHRGKKNLKKQIENKGGIWFETYIKG